jgi:hypothetical protein
MLVLVRLKKVLMSLQDRWRFVPNVPWARKSFWVHPMELVGDMGQLEAIFGLFKDSVNLSAR